jgi:predicted metal-dependent HD superfamily phosphohydrolase
MELPQHWPLPEAATLRDELIAAYADPSRHYHDTRHLTEVLGRLDELAGAGVAYDDLPVRLAAWFHDAVYDGERDAEERSAAWAEDALTPGTRAIVVDEVARLIRLTEQHDPRPGDVNGEALSDADLGILAAEQDRYDEYTADVRREYAHLGDDEFTDGRTQVLLSLLERSELFRTAYAREQWEADARSNLERELASLGAKVTKR